jgi:hypothetical protein
MAARIIKKTGFWKLKGLGTDKRGIVVISVFQMVFSTAEHRGRINSRLVKMAQIAFCRYPDGYVRIDLQRY